MRESLWPVLGAAASAALLGVVARVEAPWHFTVLIALVPWLVAIDKAPARAVLLSAALLAMGFTATAFSWFPATVAAYSGAGAATSWMLVLLLSPIVLAPQFLAGAAARIAARALGASPAVAGASFAFAYAGAEWLFPKLLADTIGHALHASPWLRQGAELAGVRGLTLVCLATNELVAAAVLLWRRERAAAVRRVAAAAGVIAVLASFGAVRSRQIEERTRRAPTFDAGLVQANITRYDKLRAERGAYATVRLILDAHLSMSRELIAGGDLDLLVWPETVYPTTFGAPKTEAARELDREIAALPRSAGVPLVLGAFEGSEAGEHNAAFFVAPAQQGLHVSSYRKALLFPLTERVPGWLDSARVRAALPWLGHWKPGPGPGTIEVPVKGAKVSFAPLICYEAVHPGYVAAAARAGAHALLTLSNDGWFPDARGARLHLVVAAFRSIELRLPQIRATNSGISALVLPSGEIVSPTRFGERAALRVTVPRVGPSRTLVAAVGDFTGPASLAAAAALLLGCAFCRRAAS